MKPSRPRIRFLLLALAVPAILASCNLGSSDPGPPPRDAGAACVPDCEGKNCGPDGCRGECGFCTSSCSGSQADHLCMEDGICAAECCPDCTGKECGSDGCGGECGQCANECTGVSHDPSLCINGTCGGVCCPSCEGKECGSDGCGGSCGECYGCGSEPDPDLCMWGFCERHCCPDCVGKLCGDDDGCAAKCEGPCPGSAAVCVGGGTDWSCCLPDCKERNCGDPDGCEGTCEGPCDDPFAMCVNGPNWRCTDDWPDCTNKNCGDSDGMGGLCLGACPGGACDVDMICDSATYTCIENPCECKKCGEVAGNHICGGTCPNVGEECKVDPADGRPACVACNATGLVVGSVCESQSACACGNDCAKLFEDAEACANDPAACQKTGQCLEDCFTDGKCADPTQLCVCSKGDAKGDCFAGDCFSQGKLTGNFAAKTLDSCNDQPAQIDIGSGNMAYSAAGRAYSWNMFIACHYLSTDGSQDLVLVQGLKICGPQACPDWILVGATTADLKVGEMKMADGKLLVEHDEIAFDGLGSVTNLWIRGLGIDGKVNFTAAGKTGKQAISGTTDITMIKYDYEVCGGNTGDPCQ